LQFMDREKLLDHVKEIGGLLKRRLTELAEEHDFVGDVRGRGLMLGMELVKDRQSKEPWKDGTRDLQMACLRRGLIVWKAGRFGNVLRLLPPLVTTKEQIEKGADLLAEAASTIHPL
jgi:4-aminobutyrate aminotransferase-like enzyme